MSWTYCLIASLIVAAAGGFISWLWLRKPQTRLSLLEQDIRHRVEEMQQVAASINKISLQVHGSDLPADWLQSGEAFDKARSEVVQAELRYKQAHRLLETNAPRQDFLGVVERGQRHLGEAEATFKTLRKRHRLTLRSQERSVSS